jgi:putative nucleotidyltransferase with HDIG domain
MSEPDREEALAHLDPDLGALFLRMAPRDQLHALRVLRRLESAGTVLEQAALLHDVGKIDAPLGTVGRSLVVLAEASRTIWSLTRMPIAGDRFRRYLDHPRIGAELLRQAGAGEAVVAIVAEHESAHPMLPETVILQHVDDRE